jgi:hypothetical protein
LTGLSNSEFATDKIRALLGEPCTGVLSEQNTTSLDTDPTHPSFSASDHESGYSTKWKPSMTQLYVWAIPGLLLGYAVLLYSIGLSIFVFAAAQAAESWGDEKKIAVVFGVFVAFVAGNYILSWRCIEQRIQSESKASN